MDNRILNDPHLDIMPEHAGAPYDILRNALVQNGMTVEQAVQALNDAWTQNHDARIQAWDQQVADDAAAAALAQQQPEEQAPQDPPQQDDAEAGEEKKKPKMKDFDDASTVGNYIAPRPAQYALRRIEDFEFVELWYFTPEGCTDATHLQLTQHDDTFGITKVDDMVTLKSISSLKVSKNVIPDADLTFRQVSMAKNAFIPLMTKYQWSDKAINAFAQLFTQLELHPLRQREFGERALIVYQARVRREWHDQMKLGTAFNIGILNEDLLQGIYKELLDQAQLRSLNEVSSYFMLCFKHRLIITLFLLLFSYRLPHPSSCPMPLFTHHASPCTLCTTHHAPFLPTHLQLRAVQTGLTLQDSRQDPVRTPKRRNYRDRDNGRNASGGGRHHHQSRSRSPTRRTPHARPSPPPYNQQQSPSKSAAFQSSTASQGLPVCALCLATDPHDTRKCRSDTLWDGSKARCHKSDEGRLITPTGNTLCSDWNSRRGCTTTTHEQRHECSGCGNKDHGAQRCPRAQRKPGAHSL